MRSSGNISTSPVLLLALVAVVIAAATFVEDVHGTSFVMQYVYGTWWFRLLWLAIAVTGLVTMWRKRLFKRFSVCLLHVSFLIILAGALTTALTSKQGMVYLRQHEPVQVYRTQDGRIEQLPFVIELDSFYIEYYPGTEAHSGYVSKVDVDGGSSTVISMNHILRRDGWRLYQTSFDEDLKGSWLTATFDPYGTAITYVGYLLLALSAILLLLNRRESFWRLLHHPALKRGLLCVALLLLFPIAEPVQASESGLPVVKLEQAEALKSEQVVYGDRVTPLNTVAIDFLQKLYGKKTFHELTAEQVLISWQLNPASWREVKLIQVKAKHRVLMERLGLKDDYLCVNDLYDSTGHYRLQELYLMEYGTHSSLEKAIQDMDEKLGVVLMLEKGTLYQPLPQDGSVQPLSEAKVKAELLYNAVPFTKILFMLCLTAGFILFFILLWQLLKARTTQSPFLRGIRMTSFVLLLGAFLFHLFGYALRWYISGTIPLTNGYETMQFVALVTMLIALLLSIVNGQLSIVNYSAGFLISGFTLLVSHLGQMNPRITSLMPVLQSPWLSSHVSLIMISYSLFAFITLNAIVALVLMVTNSPSSSQRGAGGEALIILSRLMLYPAVLLLAVGIFLGAVWANVSWGSYWSWDPKEVWALVTMIVYGIAFHRQSLPWLHRPLWFHLYMLFAFLTVLMTFFGVNYLLGGMHSYAG